MSTSHSHVAERAAVYPVIERMMAEASRWTTMGEIAEVVGGGTPRTSDPTNFEGGDIPWITPADLSGYTEKYISRGSRFITQKGLESSSARLLPAGTILFTSRAPIGYVAIARNAIATNQGFKSFVLMDGILPEYVYWWLKGSKHRAESLASGTTFLELSGRNAKKLPIPIVPIERQREIVAEIEKQFSRLDKAVAHLKRVKANLKRYKGAVLQSVTSGQLETEGQGSRERGELGGWRRLTIEELASREPRSIQSGPFGSNLLHSEFQASGKLVIGIDNVQDDAYSIGANHRISESKFAELEKYRARPQDVLITVMATVGRVCVLPENIEPAIITKHVYRITVDRAVASPEYVGIALRGARDVRAQLFGSVQGQTRPGLNGTLIKRIRVPVPPLAEQHRIVAEVDHRLSIVREVEAEVDANLKRATSLRRAILSRAFVTDEHCGN